MWLSDLTIYLLLGGALMLLYEIFRVIRLGIQEALSLRFGGIALIWTGYHLSSWFALAGHPWKSFLIVPEYIDQGLLFSLLSMAAFVVGHWLVMGGRRTWRIDDLRGGLSSFRISPLVLFAVCGVSLTLFLVTVGGLEEVWRASTARGSTQFMVQDWWGRLLNMLTVSQVMISVLGVCIAALFILDRSATALHVAGGILALLILSLSQIHQFSRASGFGLLFLGVIAVYLRGWRGMPVAACAISLALFLGHIGITHRGSFNPGLGNFVDAIAVEFTAPEVQVVVEESSEDLNFLDSMPTWTRVAQIAGWAEPDPLDQGFRLMMSLSPLPSNLVPITSGGPDLVEAMGTGDSVGLTTPAMSELYYAFGLAGCVAVGILGAIYGWFDRLRLRHPGAVTLLCAILCLASLTIGLHSSLRAMTRPLLYAFLFFHVMTFVQQSLKPAYPLGGKGPSGPRRGGARHVPAPALGAGNS